MAKSLNDYIPGEDGFLPKENPFYIGKAVRFINDHYELQRDDNSGSLTKEGFAILLSAARIFTERGFYMHIIFPFWNIMPEHLSPADVIGIIKFQQGILNGDINSFSAKQYLFRPKVKEKLSSRLK